MECLIISRYHMIVPGKLQQELQFPVEDIIRIEVVL